MSRRPHRPPRTANRTPRHRHAGLRPGPTTPGWTAPATRRTRSPMPRGRRLPPKVRVGRRGLRGLSDASRPGREGSSVGSSCRVQGAGVAGQGNSSEVGTSRAAARRTLSRSCGQMLPDSTFEIDCWVTPAASARARWLRRRRWRASTTRAPHSPRGTSTAPGWGEPSSPATSRRTPGRVAFHRRDLPWVPSRPRAGTTTAPGATSLSDGEAPPQLPLTRILVKSWGLPCAGG